MSDANQTITIRAHGKLNLGLRLRSRRPDGYHDIDTVFARLELHDRLTLRPRDEVSGELRLLDPNLPGGGGLTMDDDNLTLRAARAYLRAAGQEGGVGVLLEKAIPVAAGLGGGSSDAAAVLMGLARLYPADVPLRDQALRLGSDVPFFLTGLPAAHGRGRGEVLARADLPPLHVTLVNPVVPVSAAEAYALVSRGPPSEAAEDADDEGRKWLHNDLEAGVIGRYPQVAEALRSLAEAGLAQVAMSGSGSTCFGIASSATEATRVARTVAARHPHWWVWSGRAGV